MHATAFPTLADLTARRDALAQVADRHATVEVPAAVIARSEEEAAMAPRLAIWARRPYGAAGKVQTAARELSETTARLIAGRKVLGDAGQVIADEFLSQMEHELDEVTAVLALLRDQINAAREDRFDAQDARVAK
jgi:hypothetical protein